MVLTTHFILGFIASFLGSLTPSMLNMTTLKVSLERGKKAAIQFSFGVSTIVLLQAYIAVLMTAYIRENPMVIELLEKGAVVIFLILSVYFYLQSKKQKKQEIQVSKKEKNSFLVGLFLSVLNMFAIPFYCGVAAAFDMAGWFQFDEGCVLLFVVGSALGTFGILWIYAHYSKIIQEKSKRFTKDINLVLSIITGAVALFTLVKFFI